LVARNDNVKVFSAFAIVTPGLTGMAQVYGSYDTPPQQKLRYDLNPHPLTFVLKPLSKAIQYIKTK